MGNSLLDISMITKESAMILKNSLGMAKTVNRKYDDSFARTGAKIGSVINIRKPVRYTVTTGPALNLQDITDQSVALTLNYQQHVDFQFSSKDMELSIDEFGPRYLEPAMNALGNALDVNLMGLVNSQVYNFVGTAGTTPATALLALQCRQKIMENAAPVDNKLTLCVAPNVEASMVDALKGLFQNSTKIGEQYDKGYMGQGLGFTWKMDQNVTSHTIGALGGTGVADCATSQTGANIITNGWTSSVTNLLLPGDIVTFANTYAVNPVSFQSTGSLKQFVVTAAVSSSGGVATIPISPAIVTSGPYQNVTQGVANSSAVLCFNTVSSAGGVVTVNNIGFHENAFVLGMADLPLPGGQTIAERASDQNAGISIRVVQGYDIVNDIFPCRSDILYGVQAVYPELACRLQG